MESRVKKNILLSHGSGGRISHDLIREVFAKNFANPILDQLTDSAVIDSINEKIAFTTDSFVVDPLEFPGGDIGKLAICGTVNDLAVAGAKPLYISCGFIIEEGLSIDVLERMVISMSNTAKEAGVTIVTGDTKVVEHGKADKLFINTSGIGIIEKNVGIHKIRDGDRIIINGPIGMHGMAVMAARNNLPAAADIKSDCAPLYGLIGPLIAKFNVHFMRDPTRGGLATTLNEVAGQTGIGITIEEGSITVPESTLCLCELLGLDPLYVANEGKAVFIVSDDEAADILAEMRRHPLGRNAQIIGKMEGRNNGKVYLNTTIGTKRRLEMLSGEQLPRIC